MIHKACPVALHPDGWPSRLAAFLHPQAGYQLVKGTIEPGEHPDRAAARELYEESGLETRSTLPLGDSADIEEGQIWHFTLCRIAPPARLQWQHFTKDDGGHLFKFFWLDLEDEAPNWTPQYQAAFNWIKAAL